MRTFVTMGKNQAKTKTKRITLCCLMYLVLISLFCWFLKLMIVMMIAKM